MHTGLLYALGARGRCCGRVLKYSTFGFAVRAVGANARAAAFAGVPVTRTTDRRSRCCRARSPGSPAPSKWPAAPAYVTLDMSPGYGYSGIVIAMLAGLNPLGVVAAAIFVAGVLVGADSMSRGVAVPTYIADVIVAIALLSMLVATAFARYRLRWQLMSTHRACSATPTSGSRCCASRTPLIFGTLGVLLCERAGVLNLGIEGIMVAGALTGWLAVYLGAGLWTGVLVGGADRRGVRVAARVPDRAARAVAARRGLGITLFATSVVVLRVSRELSQRHGAADDPAVRRNDVAADPDPRAADADDAARAGRACRSSRGSSIARRSGSPCAWSARIPPPPKGRGSTSTPMRTGAIVARLAR